jgi:hypothetical protein
MIGRGTFQGIAERAQAIYKWAGHLERKPTPLPESLGPMSFATKIPRGKE